MDKVTVHMQIRNADSIITVEVIFAATKLENYSMDWFEFFRQHCILTENGFNINFIPKFQWKREILTIL